MFSEDKNQEEHITHLIDKWVTCSLNPEKVTNDVDLIALVKGVTSIDTQLVVENTELTADMNFQSFSHQKP